ncbi:hypothetical protein D3C84_664670 [compost metagenome]
MKSETCNLVAPIVLANSEISFLAEVNAVLFPLSRAFCISSAKVDNLREKVSSSEEPSLDKSIEDTKFVISFCMFGLISNLLKASEIFKTSSLIFNEAFET